MQDKYKLSTSIIIRKIDPDIHILVFELRSSQLMYINIWHRINYTGKIRKTEFTIIKIIVYIISYTYDLLIISAHFNGCIGHELSEACNFSDLV